MRLAYPAVMVLLALAAPATAKADDAPLFHVTDSTVACADAAATRSLTNPNEARRSNPSWFKSTFADGRCVSVTSKSPWRFVSRDGDVAMMDYAGTIGPPGSYYFSVAQLTDANGYHPGDVGAPTSAAPAATPSATAPPTSETALAPNTQPAAPMAGGKSQTPTEMGTQPTWGATNILLLAVALLLAAFGGYVVGKRSGPRT